MEIESVARASGEMSLRPRNSPNPVPLTAPQLRWWRALQRDGRQSARTMASAVQISGHVDRERLRESVEAVVRRHESLRTRIVIVNATPMQWIDAPSRLELDQAELDASPNADAATLLRNYTQQLTEEKVDLSTGPLFKAALIRTHERQHVLVLMADHIVSDAASLAIVNSEIWHLYSAPVSPASATTLAPLRLQFGDYAVWQAESYANWRTQHEAYWRSHLAGASRTQLPTDYLSNTQGTASAVTHFPLGKHQTNQLREIARLQGIPLPFVALALQVCAISRWCGQRSLLLTFVTHGRHCHPELRTMTGFLASSLLLRVQVGPDDSFLDLLEQIRNEFASAFAHYDFGHVVNLLPEYSTDVCFNWLPNQAQRKQDSREDGHACAVSVRPYRLASAWQGKLWPFFYDTSAGINVSVWYRPDLFSAQTIDRFGEMLRCFGQAFALAPNARVASIDARAPEDRPPQTSKA